MGNILSREFFVKTLIAAFLIMSSSAFANELDATEALLSTLPAGVYTGITPHGDDCEISVRTLSDKVAVVATTATLTKRSEVVRGAVYRWNPGNRSYLATTFTTTLRGSTENILRTIAVSQSTQYVVVADRVVNDRNASETKIECVINL